MFFPSCLTAAGALPRAAMAVAALTCAAPAFAHFPPPTPPATVYYGTLTAAEEAEVQAWGIAYWTRVEAGTPSTMPFSTAAMNSHLFNPFRGTRATLENLKLLDASDCDKAIIEGDVSTMDTATLAKRQALKDAMTDSKFATDPITNVEGTIEHIAQILNAAATNELVTYTEGGSLVSKGLPLDIVVAAGADPDFATELSANTVNAINALVVASPGYVLLATGGTEAQTALSGGASRTDQVHSRIRTLLNDLNVIGYTTQPVRASFGVYGELPIVLVRFADAAVMVDAVSGAVTSPSKRSAALDVRPLLAAHTEFAVGTGSRLFTSDGCTTLAGADWEPTMPPGSRPRLPIGLPPAWPMTPDMVPANVQPGRVGWWTDWTCITTLWTCSCTAYGQDTDSTGKIIWVKRVCSMAGACGGAGPAPASLPPGAPNGPGQMGPWTCIQYWWY